MSARVGKRYLGKYGKDWRARDVEQIRRLAERVDDLAHLPTGHGSRLRGIVEQLQEIADDLEADGKTEARS
jgi:hypothetical protein